MSLFGKLLAIFNVFAVLGTLVLMAMNYARRDVWEYQVFLQDVLIQGLPVDDEKDEQQQPLKDRITPKLQQDLFKQASPSTGVATQKAEVDRVHQQLSNQYQAAGDKKKQMAALAYILAPMAETIGQRQQLIAYQTHLSDDKAFDLLKARLIAAHKAALAPREGKDKPYEERFHDALAASFTDPPGPLGEAFLAVMKADPKADPEKALEQSLDAQHTQLQGQFEQMFRNALSGGEGVKSGALSQQKHAIARLLFSLVEVTGAPGQAGAGPKADLNDPAYKRVFAVVGVKAALEAAHEQAEILQDLAFETAEERQRERSVFAVEHRKVVDLVRDKKTTVDDHALLLKAKKKERETHAEQLAARKRDVDFYQDKLTTARQQTAKDLEELRKLSDALFVERVKLRNNTEDNQKLEKEIRALEQGR